MKPKILCVDDEHGVLQSLERTLRDQFQVLTCDSPGLALKTIPDHPDCTVVLTDYMMPEMNGVDFLRRVRTLLPFATRAVLSAQIDLTQISDAINSSDIHKFFLKPWENDYLKVQMLEAHLLQRTIWLSSHDSVTDLHNHRFFQEQLEVEIEAIRASGGVLSLLMIDVDSFKSFNDRFGHPQGDALLKELAVRFKDALPRNSHICRYGGEEFAVILPGVAGNQGLALAEKLRMTVETKPITGPTTGQTYVTVSVGLAEFPKSALNKSDLIGVADRALYQAKRQGRNQTVQALFAT